MDLVPSIFFEKQEGNLCAQHALNALLQGNYFTAVDLAEIGRMLDEKERQMGSRESGHNYDDSGYFSIQVIQNALSVWNLEVIPVQSKDAKEAMQHPEQQVAFICNLDNHWFTLRKFAVPWRWYNLNSTQNGPTYLSEVYLGMLLQQIQSEKYSVFLVRGELPACQADALALTLGKPTTNTDTKEMAAFSGKGYTLADQSSEQIPIENMDEDMQIAKAIQDSLKSKDTIEEIRRKRLARFGG